MLRLKLLGTPTIHLGNRLVALKTSKSQALLFYLAINPGGHSRDVLAALLWTEMSNQQARKNLRDALVSLRAIFGDYLGIEVHKLTFNHELPSEIDVKDFVMAVTRGRAVGDPALVESALQLYQADFLTGFQLPKTQPFDHWALQKREELYNFAITHLQWLATTYLQTAAYPAGLRITQRLLTLEPWQEAFHLLQMRFLAQSGNRVAALRQFELCQQLLADELGLGPSPSALALYEQIKDGLFALAPMPPARELEERHSRAFAPLQEARQAAIPLAANMSALPHNLPRQLTTLVGRAAEITALIALIDQRQPLITLCGEAGMGKSHLALATARILCDQPQATHNERFYDGIWFVTLADIVAAGIPKAVLRERVAARIGEAVGLNFAGATKLSTQLESYLRQRRLLLILDNFEHLLVTADLISDLLQRAAALQIVVTSRARLNLHHEQVMEIEGLPVPTTIPQAEPWIALRSYAAFELFDTCAQRINANFTLDPDNAKAIVQICDLVAGSPLAIKLAVGLLDIYTCPQIATLLAQDYRVLSNEQPDLPRRQRSMQAVLDAAWQQLDQGQAQVLAACSLLQRVFTLEAASAITEGTTEQLQSLVSQSWLRYNPATQHFMIHALLRQYATRQLAASPTAYHMAQARHAAYHMAILQYKERALCQDPAVVEQFRLAWSDIRTAWMWSIDQQRLDLLAAGAQGLANYCQLSGTFQEARQLLETAIEAIRQQMSGAQQLGQQATLTQLRCCSLIFYFYLGQQKELSEAANEARAWSQQLENKHLLVMAMNGLTHAAQLQGRYQEMRQLAQAAYAQLTPTEQPWLVAQTLTTVASAFWASGDFEQGIAYFHKVFKTLQQAPDLEHEARTNLSLGFLYQRQKKFMQAYDHLAEALRLAHIFHSQRTIALTHLHLGDLWRDLGAYERSHSSYREATIILEVIGDKQWLGWLHISYGRLLHLQGDQAGARSAYQMAMQLAQAQNFGLIKLRAALMLGHLLAEQGNLKEAASAYETACNLNGQLDMLHSRLDAYAGLAVISLAQNDLPAAQLLVEAAVIGLSPQGIEFAEEPAQVYQHCITVLQAIGDTRAATLRRAAQHYLQQKVNEIDDAELRYSYQTQVTANHKLLNGE